MQRIADFLKRFPWIMAVAVYIWRLGRPRFSVGVIGVLLNEAQDVLLVEHVFHPKRPWGLPGGWVDRSETLATAITRELSEELALEAEVETILLVEIIPNHPNHIDIAYLCRAYGPVGSLSNELLGYRWVSVSDLPSLPKLHYRAVQRAIEYRSRA